MEQLFNIDFKKISSSSEREALDRKKNFEIFLKTGLPNKKKMKIGSLAISIL